MAEHGIKHGEDSRLRGQTTKRKSILIPDPIRHFSTEDTVDRRTHMQCFNSGPQSHPVRTSNSASSNEGRKSRNTFNGYSVNYNRHTSCRVSSTQQEELTWRPRTRQRILTEKVLSKSVAYSSDLPKADKLYLYHISQVYSIKNMQHINQRKYAMALDNEQKRGNYDDREIKKYLHYINSPRQNSWGTGNSSFTHKKSATARRKKKKNKGHEEELKTNKVGTEEETENIKQETQKKEGTGIIEEVLAEPTDTSGVGHHSPNNDKSDESSGNKEESNRRASDGGVVVFIANDTEKHEDEVHRDRASDEEGNTPNPATRATDSAYDDTSRGRQNDNSASISESRGQDSHPREGYDRPKSRFGRRVLNENANDSDDDYDTDSSTDGSSDSSEKPKSERDKDSQSKTEVDQAKTEKCVNEKSSEVPEEVQSNLPISTDEVKHTDFQERRANNSKEQQNGSRERRETRSISNAGSKENIKHKSAKSSNVEIPVKSRYRNNSESSRSTSVSRSASSRSSVSNKPPPRKSSRSSSSSSVKPSKEASSKRIETSSNMQNVSETEQENITGDNSKITYRSVSIDSRSSKRSDVDDAPLNNNKDVDTIEY